MNNVTTFDNFPPFATNGSRNMNTESAKYAVGFLEGETFPAEWANYLFHGATKGVSDLNTAVQSIWKENINVIQGSGQTPSSSDNTQLKTAIELMIQNAVLTANAQVLAQAKLDAHPVGSLYWSSNPTDPSILFGGTWTQIKDRFILAAGDTYGNGSTGGAATVKLTELNLPAHKHYIDLTSGVMTENESHLHSLPPLLSIGGLDSISGFAEGTMLSQWGRWGVINSTTSYKDIPHKHYVKGDSNPTGGNTAHENMPPYVVKYCWERTA